MKFRARVSQVVLRFEFNVGLQRR